MAADPIETFARIILQDVTDALARGTKHFTIDGEPLLTVEAVIGAIARDGQIVLEATNDSTSVFEDLSVVEVVKVQTFTFTVDDEVIHWDVGAATEAVTRGEVLARLELPLEYMMHVARNNDYDPAHVAEVDYTQPGIAVEHEHDGQMYHVLIDGTHRCVRALLERKPFYAWILSRAVADRCRVTL